MLRSGPSPAQSLAAIRRWLPFVAVAALLPACSSTSDGTSDDGSGRAAMMAPSAGAFPLSDVLWGGPILRDETISALHYADEHLFVATGSGALWSVSKDGLPRWNTRQLPEPPAFAPVSNGETVAVLSKGDLYCFDRNTGALRLKRRLPFATSTAPALSTSTGYFPSWDNDRVHAVDLTTGALGWFFRARGPVTATPVVAGAPPRQVLYVASEDGAIAAVEAAPAEGTPGEEAWSSKANGANRAGLATTADGAILLVASEDTFLYGIDRVSGVKRWAFGAETPLRRAPHAVAGAVYLDTGLEFVSLDAADGSVRWRQKGSYRFLVRNGAETFALSGGNQVVVFNDATGEILGRHDMSAYAFFATNTESDVLYAATRDGQIFALGRKTL